MNDPCATDDNACAETPLESLADMAIGYLEKITGRDDSGYYVLVDPVEAGPIGGHYALSHGAAAFLLRGIQTQDASLCDLGWRLLEGVLGRWREDSARSDFHNDFNLFALCVIDDRIPTEKWRERPQIREALRRVVIKTSDSRHDTVNWLPMRAYVNAARFRWTGRREFAAKRSKSLGKVDRAIGRDGLIDDRIPRGGSFSPQYHIGTIATLLLENSHNDCGIDRDRASGLMRPILRMADPTGDVNYFGRGCNQLFAWGPWLFLLQLFADEEAVTSSREYLAKHLPIALDADNLLLNDFDGHDRLLWWDYHYVSVYVAHLALWLVLAAQHSPVKMPESSRPEAKNPDIAIIDSPDAFVSIFKGRTMYSAEGGPMVTNLWLADWGTVFKGPLGPWLGTFGERHASFGTATRNFLGAVRTELGSGASLIVHRNHPAVKVDLGEGHLVLTFQFKRKVVSFFNMPCFPKASALLNNVSLEADSEQLPLRLSGSVMNPYGVMDVWESPPSRAKSWVLRIPFGR